MNSFYQAAGAMTDLLQRPENIRRQRQREDMSLKSAAVGLSQQQMEIERARQEAADAAEDRRLRRGGAAAGWGGGFAGGAPAPIGQPQRPAMPQGMGQQPSVMPTGPASPGVVQGADGVDVATVVGMQNRPAMASPPPPMFQYDWRAEANFYAANGRHDLAAEVAQRGQAAEMQQAQAQQTMATAQNARAGAFLAPLLRMPLPTKKEEPAYQEQLDGLLGAAPGLGIVIPEAVQRRLEDPTTSWAEKMRLVQSLALAIDPESVGRESSQLFFAPQENVDLRDRAGSYDPRTGTFVRGPAYGVPAERVFQEQQANARNAADNATQVRIAGLRAEVQRLEIARATAQGEERLALDARIADLKEQEMELTRQWLGGASGGGPRPGAAGVTWN